MMQEPADQNPASKPRRFVDRSGKFRPWLPGTAGCPPRLRTADKSKLVAELARLEANLERLQPILGKSGAECGRTAAMRALQDERIQERVAMLQEIISEAAQRRSLIDASQYAAIAAEMSRRTRETFSPATLYIEPYRSVLRGQEADWTSDEARLLRRLGRHSRKRLMQLIAKRKREIAAMEQERGTLLAAKPLDPAKVALFNEHHPARWLKKAMK